MPDKNRHLLFFLLHLFHGPALGFVPSTREGLIPKGSSRSRHPTLHQRFVHATVVSPFARKESDGAYGMDQNYLGTYDDRCIIPDQSENEEESCNVLQQLSTFLHATPVDLLRFESTPDGVRGVYLNGPVKEGEVILSIPLSSCLIDISPPAWFQQIEGGDTQPFGYDTSSWASRLAASLIDLQLIDKDKKEWERNLEGESEQSIGHGLWLSLLPNPKYLQASLPIHWSEDVIRSARSTALELGVDSSFFVRAEAVEDLMAGLKRRAEGLDGVNNLPSEEKLRQICSDALDLVQTRTCQILLQDRENEIPKPVRVLAPIFDFLNHGSIQSRGDAAANAQFELESGNRLVVRARRDVDIDEEVLIDYGDSARPAWKCLLSYGFVPKYNHIPGPGEEASEENSAEDDNIAEVYMDGVRYEVGPSHLPFEMVAAAAAELEYSTFASFDSSSLENAEQRQDQVSLTPEIALKLARRISDVAYYLLLEPEHDVHEDEEAKGNNDTSRMHGIATASEVISSKGAASLRWSQHRVLLACAQGLTEFATDNAGGN